MPVDVSAAGASPAITDFGIADAIPRDPLTPFDVPGGPPAGLALGEPITLTGDGTAGTVTLTAAHIEQAYVHFVTCYQDSPGINHKPTRDRARKSRDALLTRAWRVVGPAETGALPEETSFLSAAAGGSVLLLPGSRSDTYMVDDQDCRIYGRRRPKGGPAYCPDSLFATVRRTHRDEAYPVACYHTIARELLRLAVVIAAQEARAEAGDAASPAEHPADDADTACALATVQAPDLWAACFLAQRAGGPVTIRIAAGDLSVSSDRRRVVLNGTGEGACAVTVDADTFDSLLLAPLKQRVTSLDAVEVIIDLSGGEPLVAFSGAAGFGCAAPATRLRYHATSSGPAILSPAAGGSPGRSRKESR
ncbi:MAG: hypothetical protein DIU80_016800 [Chloroflexota bacterium]